LILWPLTCEFALGTQIELGRVHPPIAHKEIDVTTFRRLIPALLIASVAVTQSSRALAAEPLMSGADERLSKTISLRDLDLSEPSHLPILYSRVQQGASAVCDATVRSERRLHRRVPAGWRDQCVQSAVDEAIRRVNDPRLTALHSRSSELVANRK
jgi:UrcA family protein